MKPIVITAGEPAGIGPDLVLRLAGQDWSRPLVAIADLDLLRARADLLGIDVELLEVSNAQVQNLEPSSKGILYVLPVVLPSESQAGHLTIEHANYVLETLDTAVAGCLSGDYSAMVTGPVHKGVINSAGHVFSGHTEYLQQKCGVDKVVMMLANSALKVALASTHLPLKDVSAAITTESLTRVIELLVKDMQCKFGIQHPRILVAGLNPHAGESGHMGREELDVIEPVLSSFADEQVELIGPLPADTLFTPKYLEHADAVLAMYHDQGLPVLKYVGFGKSVNITLGLPIIRTSVDHGTALDLAGTGNADAGSLFEAVKLAIEMADSASENLSTNL